MPSMQITREAFARLWNNHNIPTRMIADHLGITRATVSWHAHNMGLPGRGTVRKCKVKPKDRPLFAHLWNSAVSVREIAAHFGMKSAGCASGTADRLGLKRRVKGGSGGSGGWPRNTPIAVALANWNAADEVLLAAMRKDPATKRRIRFASAYEEGKVAA